MLDELPEDVLEELNDPRFLNRTHGTRGTYAKASDGGKGCRGPLCRKSERDEGHAKYARKRARDGKDARVGLLDEEARARDELLTRIIAWHRGVRVVVRSSMYQPDTDPEDEPELEAAV